MCFTLPYLTNPRFKNFATNINNKSNINNNSNIYVCYPKPLNNVIMYMFLIDSCGIIKVNNRNLIVRLHEMMMTQCNDSHLQEVIKEVNDVVFSQSKDYCIFLNQVHRLEYLDLNSWLFHNIKMFIQHSEILCQSTEIKTNDTPLNIEIDKPFEMHQLKSKRRRASLPQRFSFNTKNTINTATKDNRTPIQIFEAILKKLHQTYNHEELKLLCQSCNYDLAVPQFTKEHVYLGNAFIKSLIKKFKRDKTLTYGEPGKIEQILKNLGYSKQELYDVLQDDVDNPGTLNNPDIKHVRDSWQRKMDCLPSDQPVSPVPSSDQIYSPAFQGDTDTLTENVKSEILGQQANLSWTDYNNIFNILQSMSQSEVILGKKYKVFDKKVFNTLSNFVKSHDNFFLTHDNKAYKRFKKNSKRYFRLNRYNTYNKRARKLIKNIFFTKKDGQCMIIKDHIVELFNDKKMIFYNSCNNKDILLQQAELQQAKLRQGSVPYVRLTIGKKELLYCLDSGCSNNLLTNKDYLQIKHLETLSYSVNNVSLRNITDGVKDNIINRVSLIPITIGKKIFVIKFYIGSAFARNFLGSDFLMSTGASIIFQKNEQNHVLMINEAILPLEYLFLSEVVGNSATLHSLPQEYSATPEKIISENLSFQQQAFDIFKSEDNLNRRVAEILKDYDCIKNIEIQASAGDLNYEELTEEEVYPATEINDYLDKRTYLPTFEDNIDPFKFNNDHMTEEQSLYLKNIIKDHEAAISTPKSPLGSFKLFQASITFFPGKKSVQNKRNIHYDLINEDIQRMVNLDIISENMTSNLDSVANLVIVSKSSRLCKADKYVQKKQGKDLLDQKNAQKPKNGKNSETSKNPQFRLTVDLSDVNSILWGQKFVNLSKHEEILENLDNCFLSKFDIAEYFFCFHLDQKSQRKINFYFKNKIYSFNRLPQGLSISPFYSVLGTSLSFSLEGLKLFLEKFPEYQKEEVFNISDINKLVLFYVDDGLVYSKKSLGWKSHFLIVKYVLFTFELVGLKIKLEKCEFLVSETKFLGLFLNTEENIHYIPQKKLSAFCAWPSPDSQGELNSRLSCLNFYSKYLPYIKQVTFPLLELAKADKFIWTDLEEKSWSELKFLLKFSLKLHFVQPTDKLLLFTDSSALSAGFVLVKVDKDLHFYPVMAESKLYVKSEKRTSIIFKEALSLLFALQKTEKYIKSSHNTVMLFSDASSLSQIKNLKNSNSKLYELSLLLTSFPNLQVNFIKGRYNCFADIMSRRVFSAILNDDIVDPDILSISQDVRQLLKNDMISMSHQSLNEYLLENNKSKMIDLMTTKRVFNIKKEHLKLSSPLDIASERQLLFLLSQSSQFDLRHLNLSVLRDYLMGLNKTKVGKHVLEEFIKYSMTKVSKECLNQLYPMDKNQIDRFLKECENHNCPSFVKTNCKNLPHPLETKLKNVYLDPSHNWKYIKQDKTLAIDNTVAENGLCNDKLLPIENELCEANLAICRNNNDVSDFLFYEKCDNCLTHGSNSKCIYRSIHNVNLVNTLESLYLTLKNIDKNLVFPDQGNIGFDKIFSQICLKSNNVTKLLMVWYFSSIKVIECFYKIENNLDDISDMIPIFFSCSQQFTLQISQEYNETIIGIYLTESIEIDQYKELDLIIDLNMLLSDNCYLQSCQISSVICCAPELEIYPNLLHIRKLQLINFEEHSVIMDISQPIMTFNIYDSDKKFELIMTPKQCFEGMYTNLMSVQKLNSIQFLSCILAKQLLNMNEFRTDSIQNKVVECNFALLNSKEDTILQTYEQNFKEINDLSHMFNLLFTKKSDFDKQNFILSQKINYPKYFSKAENLTSLRFVLDKGVLMYKASDGLKIVLPPQIVTSTFINIHLRGIHTLDTLIKTKILRNFWVPIKTMNASIKNAVKTCLNCTVLTPKAQKRYVGLKRSLNDHLCSGKHLYVDITYLKVGTITWYLFLIVDQASGFIMCKLFECISVKLVREFLLTLFGIISLTECVISDSGPENTQILTQSLQALGIRHKKISPYNSNANLAESNIRVFRHSLKKLINNSLHNQLKIDYLLLSKLCVITANLINSSCPYNSLFSRKELFHGFYYYDKGHKMSRYISEKSLLKNVDNIILYKDIQKFYTNRIRILNEKGLKANKYVKPITLKRGEFVVEKLAKDKQLLNNTSKQIYFCILRILDPRCVLCNHTDSQCNKCEMLPTNTVELVNLTSGNKTRRSVNQITHIELKEVLDPQFFIDLNEISSKTPNYLSQNIGINNTTLDNPQNYYNLRSKDKEGQIVEGNFGLIKKQNKYYFKDTPCQILDPCKEPQTKTIAKTILKHNPKVLSNTQLWASWNSVLSSDQLVSIIKALQLNLEMLPDYESIHKVNPDININPYMRALWRDFFASYKRGDIHIALSNKIHLHEVCQKKIKRQGKLITFDKNINICLIEDDTPIENSPNYNVLQSTEDKICLLCVSGEEAKLLKK